jgi:glycosyltransferase involved in cell wall biosynthesis
MVRALAEGTPELQWAMTGWGPLQPEEWRLSNLSVLRGIPQTSLAGYYRCADLLVLPSKGEGFPLVIQEAMACGTPALTNVDTLAAIPGVERFLHGETLEGPDAVDAWRRSIRRILEEQTEDGRLAVAEYAAREWAWDRVARAYCGIFSAVVGC